MSETTPSSITPSGATPGSAGDDGAGSMFNPALFAYAPGQGYAWQVFDRVTITVMTFNRLALTRRFFDGLLRHTHRPVDILALDNASDDGTQAYLREMAARLPGMRVIENPANVGRPRGLLLLQRALPQDGLVVMFDNDIEILSNYWLEHLQKAFHAYRLARGHVKAAFGLRLLNCEEYGFRFAHRHETLRIAGGQNDPPRSSYAAASKDGPPQGGALDEEVVIGWSGHLLGATLAIPAALLQEIRLDQIYPAGIGGDDTHISAELQRLGAEAGYIENGPVARHNDWPYSAEKIALYSELAQTRMVSDRAYAVWKLRQLWRRWRGQS